MVEGWDPFTAAAEGCIGKLPCTGCLEIHATHGGGGGGNVQY